MDRPLKRTMNTLGIVIPCYNEADALPVLFEELKLFIVGLDVQQVYVLFIDDGSTDDTFSQLSHACEENPAYGLLAFRRNFGHQAAVSAGLQMARGDAVVVIDADLQDPLNVVEQMVEKWREGYDVVYGIRRKRKEGLFLRTTYHVFYVVMNRLAHYVASDSGDFSLMDRSVVDLINALPEHNRFIRGLRGWVGGKQFGLEYERMARVHGHSKYNLRRLWCLALNGVLSFSTVPLRLASWLGFIASAFGFVLFVWAIGNVLLHKTIPPGWASTAVMIVFFSGVQLVVLGIVGEYIGRIYDEVKDRPSYLIQTASGWAEDKHTCKKTSH